MSREVRTEHAKAVRRATGTNNFRDKELVMYDPEISPTICANMTKENEITEIYEIRRS